MLPVSSCFWSGTKCSWGFITVQTKYYLKRKLAFFFSLLDLSVPSLVTLAMPSLFTFLPLFFVPVPQCTPSLWHGATSLHLDEYKVSEYSECCSLKQLFEYVGSHLFCRIVLDVKLSTAHPIFYKKLSDVDVTYVFSAEGPPICSHSIALWSFCWITEAPQGSLALWERFLSYHLWHHIVGANQLCF